MKNKLTKEENAIVDKINIRDVEFWASKREFWRIYKHVINVTKKYLQQKSLVGKSK